MTTMTRPNPTYKRGDVILVLFPDSNYRIGQIIAGKCSVDSDTALRFGHWFGADPLFWLNLQMQFDVQRLDISS